MNNEEFLNLVEKVYAFHTRRAPGIPISVEMVNLALKSLGEAKKLCAIAETRTCLPDSIQFITGCTIGNGDLKVLDQIGRFALTLYDRKNGGKGIRIFVDQKKINSEKTPELYRFFMRQRSDEVKAGGEARKASAKLIVEEFLSVNRDIFTLELVRVKDTKKPPLNPCFVCENCGESFVIKEPDDKLCLNCSDSLKYYEKD